MSDWLKYKGGGPWEFNKSNTPNIYNVGNRIVTSDDPVWSMERTGVPITLTHKPCGYWIRRPTTPGTEPPPPTERLPTSEKIDFVTWLDTGTTYGRFIGIDGNYPYKAYYSDDGGFVWVQFTDTIVGTQPPSGYSAPLYATLRTTNNKVFVGLSHTPPVGTFIWYICSSDDGINYTNVTLNSQFGPSYYGHMINNVCYHQGKYYAGYNRYGASYLAYSVDGITWSRDTFNIGAYGVWTGIFSLGDYLYLFSYNYNYFWKVRTSVTPFVYESISAELLPFLTSQRWTAACNDSLGMFSGAYVNTAGNWYGATVNPFYYDYGSGMGLWYASDGNTLLTTKYYLSINGLDWYPYNIQYDAGARAAIAAVGSQTVVICTTRTPYKVVLTF